MCNPVAAASFVAQSAGGAMNARAQTQALEDELALEAQARNRRSGFLDSEYGRQALLTKQNEGVFNRGNALFSGDVGQEIGNRGAQLAAAFTPTMGAAPIRDAIPKAVGIVADAEQGFRDQATQRATNLAGALANLRAFGDVFLDKGRELTRGGQDIDQGLNFMRGSRGVLAAELESAQVDPTERQLAQLSAASPLGDLLRGAGQIGMYYGLADASKLAAAKAGRLPGAVTPGPAMPVSPFANIG